MKVRRAILFFAVSAVSIAFDQLTKVWAVETLKGKPMESFLADTCRLVFATNDGAFLSLGSTLPPAIRTALLSGAVGILLLGLTIYSLTSPKVTIGDSVGYALIASGGVSNWVDRLRFEGSVVDFMNVGIGTVIRSGIFNVADLAIIAGIVVLFFTAKKKEKAAAEPAAPPSAA
jgi:signal peptidase II